MGEEEGRQPLVGSRACEHRFMTNFRQCPAKADRPHLVAASKQAESTRVPIAKRFPSRGCRRRWWWLGWATCATWRGYRGATATTVGPPIGTTGFPEGRDVVACNAIAQSGFMGVHGQSCASRPYSDVCRQLGAGSSQR